MGKRTMLLVHSMLNLVLQTKDYSVNSLKQLMGNNESKFKNFFNQSIDNQYVEQIIEPNIKDIEYMVNVVKWTIEFCEIISAAQVFGIIYDRLKWKIVDH